MNIQNIINKNKKYSNKLIASALTIFVLAMLVVSGPANAFEFNLNNFSDNTPEKGDIITTESTITINPDERMPLPNPAGVFIDDKPECVFSISSQKTECDNRGITVELISSSDSYGYGYEYNHGYGYGYAYGDGYGYGYQDGYSNSKFTYKITIDTQKYSVGEHKINLAVNVKDDPDLKVYFSEEKTIIIMPKGASKTDTNNNIDPSKEEKFLDNKLSIDLGGNTSGSVIVSEFNSLPPSTNSFNLPSLGKYFAIETDIISNISGTEIRVYYTDAEVSSAGVVESSLRLYYYNTASGLWEIYDAPNGGVDITNNYVWAKTNHFSVWGIFGTAPSTSTPSGGRYHNDVKKIISVPVFDDSSVNNESIPISEIDSSTGDLTDNLTPPAPGAFSRITGAVIGTLGNTGGIIIIVFIIGIIGLSISVSLVRKRRIRRLNTDNY